MTSLSPEDLINEIQSLARTASFEMGAKDLSGLEKARENIDPGTMVSITWMPDDTHEMRIAAAKAVRAAGFEPVPHYAARRIGNTEEIRETTKRLAGEAGVTKLFFIAGDVDEISGEFASSLDLLKKLPLADYGIRSVGFGGHPEGNPKVSDALLLSEMDAKITTATELGLDPFVVTQFSFKAEPQIDWLKSFRARGHKAPVRLGLAGPCSIRTLLRYAAICGVGTSAKAMFSHGATVAKLLTDAGPDPILRTLAEDRIAHEYGPIGLHFFPFGGFAKTSRWVLPVAKGTVTLDKKGDGFSAE